MSIPSRVSCLPEHEVASLEIMKEVATMLETKEWDSSAADCMMLNDRTSYSLRSHRGVGSVTLKHSSMAYWYFIMYGIGFHVTLEL